MNRQNQQPDRLEVILRISLEPNLKNYIGKELYFVIENGNETGFSFINVDDFRTSMTEKYALLRYEVMMPKQSGYRMGQV